MTTYDPTIYVVNSDDEILDSFDNEKTYFDSIRKSHGIYVAASALCDYFNNHDHDSWDFCDIEKLIDDLEATL